MKRNYSPMTWNCCPTLSACSRTTLDYSPAMFSSSPMTFSCRETLSDYRETLFPTWEKPFPTSERLFASGETIAKRRKMKSFDEISPILSPASQVVDHALVKGRHKWRYRRSFEQD